MEKCGSCYECLKDVLAFPEMDAAKHPFTARLTVPNTRMILCVDCGNKRCPKATDHRLACTNSNEVGQVGSRWHKDWKDSGTNEAERKALGEREKPRP